MNAARLATFLSVLAAGSAVAQDKPPCEVLTRDQVAPVVGAGPISTQYDREELPQRRRKAKATPLHVCGWFVKETQSAVEVHLVLASPDAVGAVTALSDHGRRSDKREFGAVSCWAEEKPKLEFASAACVGSVKGKAVKVLFRSKTAEPTIQQAKSLFDKAAAGL